MGEKSKYLDIKQSMTFTGKSQSTIRNLLRSLSESDKKRFTTKKGQKVYILQSLLEERYGRNDEPVTPLEQSVMKTIDVLREQLNKKDTQLEKKDKQIEELIERLKEANYNQGSMHKFLNELGLSENEIQNRLK